MATSVCRLKMRYDVTLGLIIDLVIICILFWKRLHTSVCMQFAACSIWCMICELCSRSQSLHTHITMAGFINKTEQKENGCKTLFLCFIWKTLLGRRRQNEVLGKMEWKNLPHSMILPTPCFTLCIVFSGWCSLFMTNVKFWIKAKNF